MRAPADGEVWTLLLGGNTKCFAAGGRGVSGRRSEDFITDRKHKKKIKCPWEGGEWK